MTLMVGIESVEFKLKAKDIQYLELVLTFTWVERLKVKNICLSAKCAPQLYTWQIFPLHVLLTWSFKQLLLTLWVVISIFTEQCICSGKLTFLPFSTFICQQLIKTVLIPFNLVLCSDFNVFDIYLSTACKLSSETHNIVTGNSNLEQSTECCAVFGLQWGYFRGPGKHYRCTISATVQRRGC